MDNCTCPPGCCSDNRWFKPAVITLGILIVLGLFGNIYLLLRKEKQFVPVTQSIPTRAPTQILATPEPDLTANWQTVLDQNNSYQFKIPSDWESYPGRTGFDRFIRPLELFTVEVNGQLKKIGADMMVELCKPPNCNVALNIAIPEGSSQPISKEKLTIGGFIATKEIYFSENSPWNSKKSFRAIIGKGDGVYIVVWQDASPIFDQILSTFKFLD